MKQCLAALACAVLLAGCRAAQPAVSVAPVPSATPIPTATPAPTPEPTPLPANWHRIQPAEDGSVTLAFTGDVNFADDWYIMQRYYNSGRTDFAQNFSPDLLELMRGADLLLCNNEFCLSSQGAPLPGKAYTFRAQPGNAVYWYAMGADLVSLANNHCGDFGPEAFLDTLDVLKDAGIPYIGAGRNLAEAQQAQYYIAGDLTIAFVGATRAEKYIMTPQATADSPGVLYTYDPAETLEAIRTAASNADFVVVYVHWGTEESTVLEQAQTDLATAYAEAGADLIVGAHPHILQGAGWRGDVPVFYSLGNFWFNMETQDTALLTVTVSADGVPACRLRPCLQSGGVTSLVTDEGEIARVLDHLNTVMESGSFAPDGTLLPPADGG
ncbi:CapA family protein [uncultured Gemmiger sp.]|uniref:CapA family protein n=1 Tax=uncultured Gemmiger sp. TaxID=1623490 RepID=UPI0025D4CE4D|nr:CapA family protein [uncultured Gemmiger sp.]